MPKISQLDGAASLDGAETVPLVKDGVTKSATLSEVSELFDGAVFDTTAAETAAGVTPTDFRYPEGDVRRYGENTTPGTTDMVTAFQNAAKTGRVILHDETYLFGSAATVPSDVEISCDRGVATITKANGGTHALLSLSSVSNVTIRRIKIDGKRRNGGGVTGNSIDMTNASNVVIENCHLFDGVNCFINEGCSNVRIENNYFEDGKSGIGTGTSSGDMVSDLIISGNYFTGQTDEGIDLNVNTERAIISNNVFFDSGGDTDSGSGQDETIDIGGETHNDLVISNNVIDLNGEEMNGLTVKINGTPSTTSRVVISGNTITNGGTARGSGIYLTKPDHVTVVGNTISNTFNGIYVTNAADSIKITGNVVSDVTHRCLTIDSSATNVQVDGNIFDATGVTANICVYIVSTITDWSITNNRILGGSVGVQVDSGASGGRISGNDISGANAQGVNCLTDKVTISGNRVHDNGTHGIVIKSVDYITLSDNMCFDNSKVTAGSFGILVDACNYVTITGNTATGTDQNGLRFLNASDHVIFIGNLLVNNAGGTNLTGTSNVTTFVEANNIADAITIHPTAPATAIADATDDINTVNKYTGKLIWDTTNTRMMRAAGSTATSAWVVVDGSTSVTPS